MRQYVNENKLLKVMPLAPCPKFKGSSKCHGDK